jgi:hypothetical protein
VRLNPRYWLSKIELRISKWFILDYEYTLSLGAKAADQIYTLKKPGDPVSLAININDPSVPLRGIQKYTDFREKVLA